MENAIEEWRWFLKQSTPGCRFRDRYRRRQQTNRNRSLFRRALYVAFGVAVAIASLALAPLPGPGWGTFFVGLGIVAGEVLHVARLLDRGEVKLRATLRGTRGVWERSASAVKVLKVITDEDTSNLITLSATDPDNDPLTYKISSLPANGKLYKGDSTDAAHEIKGADLPVALSGNQVTYKPDLNYNNTAASPDTFNFVANDGQADSNEATASIIVNPVNDAPVAQDDAHSVDEDNTLDIAAPGVLYLRKPARILCADVRPLASCARGQNSGRGGER